VKTIGIVGGGIGGVAAAAALHQLGIPSVVYERATHLTEVGAGMMLWPNATRILENLGLLSRVVDSSGLNTNFLVRNKSGKVLMDIRLGAFDVPALCTRRSDLLRALLSAVPPDQIRLGRELSRIEILKSGVRVHFSDGSVAEHSAIIGADGVHSRVRSQIFGIAEPVYRGYVVWRGIGYYSGVAVPPESNSETWGRGSRFGILQMGEKSFTWYATANRDHSNPTDPEQRKKLLLRLFSGWHEPIPELIESTGSILENGAYDLRLRRWTSGPVALLGDAAHLATPNLGQGGGMALEDAAALAKCIHGENSIEVALRRYEALRRPRTGHIQQRSQWMGFIGQWQNRAVVAGRGAVTRLLPAALFEHNLRRTYSYEV